MDKAEVISKIRLYKQLLQEKFDCTAVCIDQVFLFGSYAQGTARDDSDIDVAIVVDEISGDYFSLTPLLWKLRRKIDERIEPLLFEKGKDESGFLQEIMKTGIEIR